MEIIGKIIVAKDPVSGTSKAGNPWRKREYVLETQETYPKKVFFNFFNDRVEQYPLNIGDVIKLSFDIDSREFNDRWYVEIRAWKAEPANAATAQQPGMQQPQTPGVNFNNPGGMPGTYNQVNLQPPTMSTPAGDSSDNLPF